MSTKITDTNTCKQKTVGRNGSMVSRYLPHVTSGPDPTGYARCSECGQDVYVGRGNLSPEALQLAEHLANRADRLR